MNGHLTIGDIVKRLSETSRRPIRAHQVKYAITEYGITERGRVGITRVWSEEDLPTIVSALRRIGGRRSGV